MKALRMSEEQLREVHARIAAACDVHYIRHTPKPALAHAKAKLGPRLGAKNTSALEDRFAIQVKLAGLKEPARQHEAIEGRKFRIDFAWPEEKVCVLVQGNVHRISKKFYGDCELFCLLTIAGWRYLPISRNEIKSGKAVEWAGELLKERI